jgi:hypothetical protein
MMKPVSLAILALFWSGVVLAGGAAFGRAINLNEPEALDALQRSNPAHYEKVRKILDGVVRQAESRVTHWIRATFDARNVNYAPILLTSAPPKRRLSFVLDDTSYEAVVTLTHVRGEILPLR